MTIERSDGTLAFLNVHPTTGEIQGVAPWVGAARVLRNMHRHLNLPVRYGVPIVCSLAFLLLTSLVTSFVVYKKWWRGFAKPLRRRSARTWWGDFHRLAGVWSLWFVALITLTSFWYLAESLGLEAPPEPHVEEGAVAPRAEPFGDDAIARAIAAGRAAFPGLEIEAVALPTPEHPVLRMSGQYRAVLVRDRANSVTVDPATARVLLLGDGRDLSLHQRISEMADPLHFGYFGGYWTKIPWFLFGLAMTALAISGAAIYSLRIARERGRAVRLSDGFTGMWRGMGGWRWVALVPVLVGFALLPELFAQK